MTIRLALFHSNGIVLARATVESEVPMPTSIALVHTLSKRETISSATRAEKMNLFTVLSARFA